MMGIKKIIKKRANEKISQLIVEKYKKNNYPTRKYGSLIFLSASISSLLIVIFSVFFFNLVGAQHNRHRNKNELKLFQQYQAFNYNNKIYSISSDYNGSVSSQFIGEKICDLIIQNYPNNDEPIQEEMVQLFAFNNIDIDISLLVKFDGERDYYPYCSQEQKSFNNLGDVITAYDLKKTIDFSCGKFVMFEDENQCSYIYDNFNQDFLWETLFFDLTASAYNNTIENDTHDLVLKIYFSIPLIGLTNDIDNAPNISVYDNSVFALSILNNKYLFEIDENKIVLFIDYVERSLNQK